MAGLWLRLYTEVTRDRKLRRLPSDQRWLWIAILSVAKESPKPGWLLLADGVPVTAEDLADEAAIPIDQVEAGLKAFTEQMMIKEVKGIWHCLNWNKRNFISDTSTERVKKFRGKKNETFQKRSSNKNETPPETETDTETDTDNINPPNPPKVETPEYKTFTDWFNNEFDTKYKAKTYKDKINTRLKNYTLEQLKEACVKMKDNPHMMGDNDSKKIYATLEYITRSDKNVDKWLQGGQANGGNSRNSGKNKAGFRPSEVDWANEPPGL